MKPITVATILLLVVGASQASAGVCDYRPSGMVGNTGTAAVAAGSGAVAGAGAVGKFASLYAITNAVTGSAMIGSAAGGVGILGGTAGAGAAIVGVVINPLLWIPAAAAAVGVVAYEGACYAVGD